MKITVKAVSKNFKGFTPDGEKWYNRAGRGANFTDFSSLREGDVIETDPADDKWISSFTKIGGSEAPVKQEGPLYFKATTPPGPSEKDTQIARAVALKSAIEFFAPNGPENDAGYANAYEKIKQATKDFESYLLTGSFAPKA